MFFVLRPTLSILISAKILVNDDEVQKVQGGVRNDNSSAMGKDGVRGDSSQLVWFEKTRVFLCYESAAHVEMRFAARSLER